MGEEQLGTDARASAGAPEPERLRAIRRDDREEGETGCGQEAREEGGEGIGVDH